ncbi:glycosyltransferase family 4 protein [Chloroflexota bacterium]
MVIFYCDLQKRNHLGTSSTHVFGVLNGLSQLGHKIIFLNTDHPKTEVEVDASPGLSLWGRIKNNIIHWRIIRLLGGEITIFWLFSRSVYVLFKAFIILLKNGKDIDVIYRRHTLFNSEYLLARMFNIPLIKEVNGLIADETKISGLGNKVSIQIIDLIERSNMPRADKIIVVTSRLKEILQTDYRVPADKIVVVQNGANTDLFKPMGMLEARRELNLNPAGRYVCFVGRLWPLQRVDCLIKSVPLIIQDFPDTKFLILGDGETKPSLISLARQTGISDVIDFTGMVPHQKVPLYVNASNICIILEEYNFRSARTGSSPLKLYEYMACAKPVVTSGIPGSDEDVIKSGSGFVVDTSNIEELSGAIKKLLGDEQLRKTMGEKGRVAAVEKHNWGKVADQVSMIFRSTLQEKDYNLTH